LREFGDGGLSASSMIRRSELQALLRAARAREADAVITESLDRRRRSQSDIATIFEALRDAGCVCSPWSRG
jgi:site-specific DNA recombinase